MASWEDQYLVYFPIVTGCDRVFKVPCSLTIMRQLLTEESGDKMAVMIKNFFANIKMKVPSEALLAMEFKSTSYLDSILEIPFPSTCGRWFIDTCLPSHVRKNMESKSKWMSYKEFTFSYIENALHYRSCGVKNHSYKMKRREIVNPASVGTTIEREHSYAKPFKANPMDTSCLNDSDESDD